MEGGAVPDIFSFVHGPHPDIPAGRDRGLPSELVRGGGGHLFRVSGIPVFRDNYVFILPGITIEVAKECSGIRSSLDIQKWKARTNICLRIVALLERCRFKRQIKSK